MRMRTLMLAAAVTLALLWVVAITVDEHGFALAAGDDDVGWTAPAGAFAQDANDAGGDERVPVQVWTVFAAGGAMAVGLVLYLLRLAMGWTKPPPPQEGSEH